MEIHNLLEDLVARKIHDVCRDDETSDTRHYCTSDECRLDAICYVLNRIQPRYVSSGRGLAHLAEELQNDQQLQIDLMRLIHEGLSRVSAVKRAFYGKPCCDQPSGPCFNFPTLQGRVLDGTRFAPLSNIMVTLLNEDGPVAMFDNRWSNPYDISEHTPGVYNFWPASSPAETVGETRSFEFSLRLEGDGFETLTHHFSLEITSETAAEVAVNLRRDHHLPDLYLF